jgi:PAS domain S-box-containing protein
MAEQLQKSHLQSRMNEARMKRSKVLVVEDDRIVSRDIQNLLHRAGYEVVGSAVTGEEAVATASERRPDVILMDIRLEGEMDGIEAAELIRRERTMPVVFLTAYADDETIERAGASDPFGYLVKPFEETQLKAAIEIALYKHASERRLHESERRYATTLASIGDAVIATDATGRITFINPVAEALTKWSAKDALGLPVTDIFRIANEDTRETVEDPVAKVLRLGTIVGLANHTVLIAKDGSDVHIDDSGAPIIDDGGDVVGAVLVFRDIGHRKQMDEAMRRAQADMALVARLTRLGELAASIAHEINQPLTAIVSNAETCLRYLDQAKAAADRMAQNSHRVGDVVKSIRSLATSAPTQSAEVEINEVITKVLSLLRDEIRGRQAEVRTILGSKLPTFVGDPVQLQQVLLNLVMNALEAMAGENISERVITIESQRSSDAEIMLTVTDTGPGIDLDDAEKLFETRFTTKREGMGIGLSICRSIVEAHGGRIWAETTRGLPGAVFKVVVPTANER